MKIVVGGDARCDSMGHCAKYGSYTFVELNMNKVLDTELVQVAAFYSVVYFTFLINHLREITHMN